MKRLFWRERELSFQLQGQAVLCAGAIMRAAIHRTAALPEELFLRSWNSLNISLQGLAFAISLPGDGLAGCAIFSRAKTHTPESFL